MLATAITMGTFGVADERWSTASAELMVESAHLSPDGLTASIGIPPDKSWSADDFRGPRSPILHKRNGVLYRSTHQAAVSMDEALDELERRMAPVMSKVAELNKNLRSDEGEVRVCLLLTLTTNQGETGLRLRAHTLDFWRQADVPIDISVMVIQDKP